MSFDLSLDRLTPLPFNDSLTLADNRHCMLFIVDLCNVRFLVRVKPRAFLVHLELKLLSLSLDLRNLHLRQILRRLLLPLLVVPQQPILMRGIFQDNCMEMDCF